MEVFPSATGISTDKRGTVAHISIDPGLYSEDVALRAAYWLTDRGYIHLSKREDGYLLAEIRLKDGGAGEHLTELCAEFCNGLIDFEVRSRVAAETQAVQEALLQRAFVELLPKGPSGA